MLNLFYYGKRVGDRFTSYVRSITTIIVSKEVSHFLINDSWTFTVMKRFVKSYSPLYLLFEVSKGKIPYTYHLGSSPKGE